MYNCILYIKKIIDKEFKNPKLFIEKRKEKKPTNCLKKDTLYMPKEKKKLHQKKRSKEKVENWRKDKHEIKKEKEKKFCTLKRNWMTEETEKKMTKSLRSIECWPEQSCPKYCHTYSFARWLRIGGIQFWYVYWENIWVLSFFLPLSYLNQLHQLPIFSHFSAKYSNHLIFNPTKQTLKL